MLYWKLQNTDGKQWIIPTKNANVALGIYQPSYWKGKLLKRVLPLFGVFAKFYSPFPLVDISLGDNIIKCLESIFPGHILEYSVFLGTPSVHQKTVIQIFEGNSILGYAKVTEKECVKRLFDHEESLLSELDEICVSNIPKCLYNKKIDANRQLFVMTTDKRDESVTVHAWCELHDRFIDELQQKTLKMVLFEDSDYARMLRELYHRAESLPIEHAAVISSSIKHILKAYSGNECEMAVMHGDFTPWNMFVQDGHLFVFDWEYSKRTCPKGIDKCHFIVQTAIFEKHWNARQIMDFVKNEQKGLIDKNILEMYLLAIIAVYVCREEKENMNTNIDVYIELLKLITE